MGNSICERLGRQWEVAVRRLMVTAPCRIAAAISPRPLFPRSLPQRRIDAILPPRAVPLEEVENVAVDAQRHLLLGVGDRGLLLRQLRGLGCHCLESRFGGITRIARSAWSVGHGSSLIGLIPDCAARHG